MCVPSLKEICVSVSGFLRTQEKTYGGVTGVNPFLSGDIITSVVCIYLAEVYTPWVMYGAVVDVLRGQDHEDLLQIPGPWTVYKKDINREGTLSQKTPT